MKTMGLGKCNILKKRQIKIETLRICLYMKSLFLGWFEPLRDVIGAEQELCKEGKNRTTYAPFFDQLPADIMAVITMHKLMGLLMTGGGHGSARVLQAACSIGDKLQK
ncbi:DNA-directed RNA polymerase [Lithospermum erythrorhizon]|uniref:DNA-directed RNA polymerase n=1 Tax=Lithospermum erythrorhizon TaxID=34254 RepID=A0AAV3Q631_LITER